MASSSKAAEAAKVLVGSFPNAKPHDPAGYIAAIAATLAQYPVEVARECADPRVGIARRFKFAAPNVSDVVEWCDDRMRTYEVWAKSKPRMPELPPPPASPEMVQKVVALFYRIRTRLAEALDPLVDSRPAPVMRVPTEDELRAIYRPASTEPASCE